jgi:hypothetical protein
MDPRAGPEAVEKRVIFFLTENRTLSLIQTVT